MYQILNECVDFFHYFDFLNLALGHIVPYRARGEPKPCNSSKHMAGTHQDGNPYQTNVTKTFALQAFSRGHFLSKLHGVFCVWSEIATAKMILKNISKKVSQKNQNFPLKIGYNSGCNIKYTWLLKVKYLLNGCTDLYEI